MTLTKAELADLLFEKVGLNKREAKDMVDKAIRRNPKAASCEEILNEVYKGSRLKV